MIDVIKEMAKACQAIAGKESALSSAGNFPFKLCFLCMFEGLFVFQLPHIICSILRKGYDDPY